jgi:hypothetical protein
MTYDLQSSLRLKRKTWLRSSDFRVRLRYTIAASGCAHIEERGAASSKFRKVAESAGGNSSKRTCAISFPRRADEAMMRPLAA